MEEVLDIVLCSIDEYSGYEKTVTCLLEFEAGGTYKQIVDVIV